MPVPPAGTAPDQATAKQVQLRVSTTPPGALVSLDGKSLGKTPVNRPVASSQRAGQLKIQLRGHRAVMRRVDLRGDVRLDLALQREAVKDLKTPDDKSHGLDIKEGR
jgi:hypothetical protein